MARKRKRNDYWLSEVFPLVENRHVVGKLEDGRSPYKSTISMTKQSQLETVARKEAPSRHCLKCDKVLPKRVRVQIDRETNDVVMASVEYGYRGKGYWCTLTCMRDSAPKLAAALIDILIPAEKPTDSDGLRWKAQQALNHFRPHFTEPIHQG